MNAYTQHKSIIIECEENIRRLEHTIKTGAFNPSYNKICANNIEEYKRLIKESQAAIAELETKQKGI